MRKGILTQAAYQRSVYRKLKDDHPALSPYSWKRCAKIPLGAKELVVSEILMTGREKDLFVYAAARAVTAVAAEGGHPFGVRVSVLVPEQTEEDSIKEMTEILKETAKEQGFQILNILTEVCPDADVFTVSVTGFGTCESTDEEPEKAYDGKDLVLVNPVALEGSLRVLREKEVEIRERFVPVFLQKLLDSRGTLFAEKAVRKAEEYHADFIKPVTDGGVFGALWELAEETKTGYEVDLKTFPVRQDIIEICELFRLNPYQMASGGCLLMILEDGRGFVEACKRDQIMASVIGKMKAGKDKIILNGEERRCTDRPAEDEWFRICKGGK